MTVQEFVDGYEKLGTEKLKTDYIKEHVIIDYLPHSEKISLCKKIAKNTTHIKRTMNDKDFELFYEDSINRSILFETKIIEKYTDIIFDSTQNILSQYDLLLKNNILNDLLKEIPRDEIILLNSILDMALNDIYMNENNIVRFLDGMISSLRETNLSIGEAFYDFISKNVNNKQI